MKNVLLIANTFLERLIHVYGKLVKRKYRMFLFMITCIGGAVTLTVEDRTSESEVFNLFMCIK